MERKCEITMALIGKKDPIKEVSKLPRDDGCYALCDQQGTPEQIAEAIAEELKTTDFTGEGEGHWAFRDQKQPMYITILIKISPSNQEEI